MPIKVRISQISTETNLYARYLKNRNSRRYSNTIIALLTWKKATFTPLIFTTSGGVGPECKGFNKRSAELIATRRKESYADVITIRKKTTLCALESSTHCVKRVQGKT